MLEKISIKTDERKADKAKDQLSIIVCEKFEDHMSKKGYSLGRRNIWNCHQYVKSKIKVSNAVASVKVSLKELEKAIK